MKIIQVLGVNIKNIIKILKSNRLNRSFWKQFYGLLYLWFYLWFYCRHLRFYYWDSSKKPLKVSSVKYIKISGKLLTFEQ